MLLAQVHQTLSTWPRTVPSPRASKKLQVQKPNVENSGVSECPAPLSVHFCFIHIPLFILHCFSPLFTIVMHLHLYLYCYPRRLHRLNLVMYLATSLHLVIFFILYFVTFFIFLLYLSFHIAFVIVLYFLYTVFFYIVFKLHCTYPVIFYKRQTGSTPKA